MRTLAVLASLLFALSACKTDKKPEAKAGSGSAVATKPSEPTAGSGSGSAAPTAGEPDKRAAIELPKPDGTPLKKRETQLDQAGFDELAKVEVPGFEKKVRNQSGGLDVRFSTPRPKLAVTVTVAPCFDCTPIELEKWKAKEATLKQLLIEELRDRPDTIWELGQTEVSGTPAIFTYQFGHFFGKDDLGNPSGGFSNAYILYWNDGKNQIRVVAEYKDDPTSREDMLEIAPREDLEKLARSFLDLFTHKW